MNGPADLYGRYAHHYDGGRPEEFAALFTSDGVFAVSGREPVRGRGAIAETARRGMRAVPGIRHLISSVAIDISEDGTATGSAYVQAIQANKVSIRLVTLGLYSDRFVLDEGRWLIADHRFEPFVGVELRGAVLAQVFPMATDRAD